MSTFTDEELLEIAAADAEMKKEEYYYQHQEERCAYQRNYHMERRYGIRPRVKFKPGKCLWGKPETWRGM